MVAPDDLETVPTAELLNELKRRHHLLSSPPARVAVLGPPCVGKRTQAEGLRRSFGICRVSGSDLLGPKAEGEGSPDERAVSTLMTLLNRPQCRRGFVLEGFPTTVSQAQRLQETFKKNGQKPLEHAIFLEAPDTALYERSQGRMIHEASGRLYHEQFKPPADDGKDDFTGDELKRISIDETTFFGSLKKYREDSGLLRQFFDRSSMSRDVSSADKADTVATACAEALKPQ